jgi:hypothetical protein
VIVDIDTWEEYLRRIKPFSKKRIPGPKVFAIPPEG